MQNSKKTPLSAKTVTPGWLDDEEAQLTLAVIKLTDVTVGLFNGDPREELFDLLGDLFDILEPLRYNVRAYGDRRETDRPVQTGTGEPKPAESAALGSDRSDGRVDVERRPLERSAARLKEALEAPNLEEWDEEVSPPTGVLVRKFFP